jgi:hypothetical protein
MSDRKQRSKDGDTDKSRAKRQLGEEPKRTPGQAEGEERISTRPANSPGRTRGQAEGTEEDVEHELRKQRNNDKGGGHGN